MNTLPNSHVEKYRSNINNVTTLFSNVFEKHHSFEKLQSGYDNFTESMGQRHQIKGEKTCRRHLSLENSDQSANSLEINSVGRVDDRHNSDEEDPLVN